MCLYWNQVFLFIGLVQAKAFDQLQFVLSTDLRCLLESCYHGSFIYLAKNF